MGAKESKQCSISYEDAVKRISDAELQRLKEAFKRSAGVGRLYLSRNAFQQDVLSEGVPPNVTELLYGACGGTTKGISFKDLLCGLVLLTRGTREEKTRFLWNLYCNDDCTHIVKSEYIKAVNLPLSESISLFAANDRVNYEQFQDWINDHKNATALSKWLLSDNTINLTSELETLTFYQSLAGVTHLEEKDIGDLEKEFWRLKNTSTSGQLDQQFLGPLVSPPIPKNALPGLFNAFDENRDGHIDFKELCCGVSAACRGPTVERTRFCFKIFDIDCDGVLNPSETSQMINVLLFVAKECQNATLYKELTRKDAINDLVEFSMRKIEEHETKAAPGAATLTQNARKHGTADIEITLTVEDFMLWSVESNLKLVQPFLDLTFEVSHIVFGLWPQCRHMEYDIVRGWLKREEKRKYRVGQFWYLISHDWWMQWMHYTQSITTPCGYCKRTTTSQRSSHAGIVDEALVADESFNSHTLEMMVDALAVTADTSSLGSGSSGISTGRHFGFRPGPIDNTNLITPNPVKNVRTLTGEGGHLKRDVALVQNHDFILVPKSLWKALSRWYGDNLPLPRQVIQPPNSTEVELELYPLNLRILLHQHMSHNASLNSTWGSVSGGYGVMPGGGYAAISVSNVLQPPKRYLAYTAAFSRLATVRQIGEFLCEQLRLRVEEIRLWLIPPGSFDNNAALLEDDSMTLEELAFKDNDQILLEIRNKDLTWPEELSSLSLNQSSNNSSGVISNVTMGDRRLTRTSIMSVHAPGATGLHNLGNTCFMNAALQVLFNTQPLAQYFHREMHLYEINHENKLGTRGQLAIRYGELLKEVWTTNTRSVAPLRLRFCVTKHAPQFSGGGQHDSQELLEWMLDALHEDLNRVTEKPYSELKDSDGRPDEIVAAEAWSQHHARNQSIVIDLFYGQLKSKVSCLCCGRESVRFDPFSLLSLPLPVENYVYFEVLVILLDGSVPIKYGVRLNSESKYAHLKWKLSSVCGINPNFMLVCEIWNSQIKHVLNDDQKILTNTAKDLYVYQLPEECSDRSRSNSTLLTNFEKGLKDIQRISAFSVGHDSFVTCNSYPSSAVNTIERSAHNTKLTEMPNETDKEQFQHQQSQQSQQNQLQQQQQQQNENTQLQEISTPTSTAAAEDDEDATKQSAEMSRSPESSFVNGAQKKILTAKLLNTESNIRSSSLTIHSNASSAYSSCQTAPITNDSVPLYVLNDQRINSSECPCRDSIDGNATTTPDNLYAQSNHIPIAGAESVNYYNETADYHQDIPEDVALTRGQCKVGKYLVAVHRKITRQDTYFLSYHKTRPSLFGVPLLIPYVEDGTHKDLYCAVWMQVNRLLSPLPASTEQANHAADCDDSLGYDFPFTLRAVSSDGLICAICPWSNFCRGCEVPCNNELLLQESLLLRQNSGTSNTSTPKFPEKFSNSTQIESRKSSQENSTFTNSMLPKNFNNITIAIDWDPTALHLRYQSTLERLWTDHETIEMYRKEQIEPVDLNHCLRAFTSEEKLEQWYHCSHCKGKKPATKKLQIWKLPPILIVHLKRFNCVNNKWVKSQKAVHFPFDNFDPTPYLAAVPQETILRHRELLETKESVLEETEDEAEMAEKGAGGDHLTTTTVKFDLDDISDTENENEDIDVDQETLDVELSYTDNVPDALKTSADELLATAVSKPAEHIHTTSGKVTSPTTNTHVLRRKLIEKNKRTRLISSSLTKTPVIDGEFEDYHQHKLLNGEDKFDPKYKLYAVVSHSGMLSGGHYISYAANQGGTWYCYNDSSCREVSSQPPIDPSSAYLLFYERKGLDTESYLPNIAGKTLPSDNVSLMDADDNDSDFKKHCTIS